MKCQFFELNIDKEDILSKAKVMVNGDWIGFIQHP